PDDRANHRPALEGPCAWSGLHIMYLLDTNIISMLDPGRQAQAPALVDWIERNGASIFLSVQTITEMDAGVLKLRREKKRERADELGELGREPINCCAATVPAVLACKRTCVRRCRTGRS